MYGSETALRSWPLKGAHSAIWSGCDGAGSSQLKSALLCTIVRREVAVQDSQCLELLMRRDETNEW